MLITKSDNSSKEQILRRIDYIVNKIKQTNDSYEIEAQLYTLSQMTDQAYRRMHAFNGFGQFMDDWKALEVLK